MYRVDNATSTGSIPTPAPVGVSPDSYYTGNTVVDADHLNAMQEELVNIISSSPSAPALSKTDRTQVYTAILDILNLGTYGALNYNNLLYIEDQKTSGSAGGASTGATWNVRTLNTSLVANITGASLSTNQITLPAGTYWIEASAPAVNDRSGNPQRNKVRLRNITDSTTDIVGTSEYTDASSNENTQTVSNMSGLVTIAGTKVFELQHYTSNTVATYGRGDPTSSGEVEVYSRIKIYKVA